MVWGPAAASAAAESGVGSRVFFARDRRRGLTCGSSGGASGGAIGGGTAAPNRSAASSRRRMPLADRNAEIEAGVELSAWAIQISVRPCATHWRISSRYGLSVAFCTVMGAP